MFTLVSPSYVSYSMSFKGSQKNRRLGFNTPKEQLAHRFNITEGNRLESERKVFSRMKHRSSNLINNNIRQVQEGLERVKVSSGNLVHFETPDREERPVCFMYGKRLESRKYGKRVALLRYLHKHRKQTELQKIQELLDRKIQSDEDEVHLSPGEFFDVVVNQIEREYETITPTENYFSDSPYSRVSDSRQHQVEFSKSDTIEPQYLPYLTSPQKSKTERPHSHSLPRSKKHVTFVETISSKRPQTAPLIRSNTQIFLKPISTDFQLNSSLQDFHSDKGLFGKHFSYNLQISKSSLVSGESLSIDLAQNSKLPIWERRTLGPGPFPDTPTSDTSSAFSENKSRSRNISKDFIGRVSQSRTDATSSEGLLPVGAYLHSSQPEFAFENPRTSDKFAFRRSSVYAATISSRMKGISSFVLESKSKNLTGKHKF